MGGLRHSTPTRDGQCIQSEDLHKTGSLELQGSETLATFGRVHDGLTVGGKYNGQTNIKPNIVAALPISIRTYTLAATF